MSGYDADHDAMLANKRCFIGRIKALRHWSLQPGTKTPSCTADLVEKSISTHQPICAMLSKTVAGGKEISCRACRPSTSHVETIVMIQALRLNSARFQAFWLGEKRKEKREKGKDER